MTMCSHLALVLTCSIATLGLAYAPIKCAKFPTKELVLTPKGFARSAKDVAPLQELAIMDAPFGIVPHFTAKSDNTITWDDANLCLEAGAKRGDTVRVNFCNGRPAQRWNWISDGHGRNMIQLKDTNKCLGTTLGENGAWDESSIKLQECQNIVTQSWRLEKSVPLPKSVMPRVITCLIAMIGFGALGLGTLFWRRHRKDGRALARRAATPTRNGDCMTAVEQIVPPWQASEHVGFVRSNQLGEALKAATPHHILEKELVDTMIRDKTVEDADEVIKTCSANGFRRTSPVAMAAEKINTGDHDEQVMHACGRRALLVRAAAACGGGSAALLSSAIPPAHADDESDESQALEFDASGRLLSDYIPETVKFRTIKQGAASLIMNEAWKLQEDGSYVGPINGSVLTSFEIRSDLTDKGDTAALGRPEKVDIVRTFQLEPELEYADVVGAAKRESDGVTFYDFDLALPMKKCGTEMVTTCLPEKVILLSCGVVAGQLHVCRINTNLQQWEENDQALRELRSSFTVDRFEALKLAASLER